MHNEQGNPIFADKIPLTAFATSTCESRGVITKTWAQLALKSQERFDLAEKEKKRAQKKEQIQKMKAKKLLPRKENVSKILDMFLDTISCRSAFNFILW